MKFDANDRLEIIADLFYRETGFMAPYKDQAPAMHAGDENERKRQFAWECWSTENRTEIHHVLTAVERYTEREEA